MAKEIEHRWCNQNFGKNGTLTNGNTSCDTTSFYSYRTVIAQWLDKEKKLMAVVDLKLSSTTQRHIYNVIRAIPEDVTVLYYNHGVSSWYGYPNVDTLINKENGQYIFDSQTRKKLVRLFIERLFEYFKTWKDSKQLTIVNDNKYIEWSHSSPLRYWRYFTVLDQMYGDRSLKTWLKETKVKNAWNKNEEKTIAQKKRMVKAYLEGKSSAEILDATFGAGTYQAWFDRTNGLRKADHKRQYLRKVTKYIYGSSYYSEKLTAKEFERMSGMDIFNLKMARIEKQQHFVDRHNRLEKSKNNLFYFIGFRDRTDSYSTNYGYFIMPNGEKIKLTHWCWRTIWNEDHIKSFKNAVDKVAWRNRFAKYVKLQMMLFDGDCVEHKLQCQMATESDLSDYAVQCLQLHRKRAQRKEQQYLAYQKKWAEEKAAREQRIKELRALGVEGCREAWYSGLVQNTFSLDSDPDFYYGGNVLLRWENACVKTSKNIAISIGTAKAFFLIIQKWHQDPSSFSPVNIKTMHGSYRISSYKNDILTAGCHQIAYVEMERMYNEIIERCNKSNDAA